MSKNSYPTLIVELIDSERLMELGPGSPNRAVEAKLRSLRVEDIVQALHDRASAQACLSGLWLYHDFLDESHTISQSLPSQEGSYWHAIMHRREPDPSNSKYWFRKVGPHPVLQQLVEQAPDVGYEFTDPFAFVDFVESVRGTGSADEETAKRVQQLEWQLLFDHCYKHAVGG